MKLVPVQVQSVSGYKADEAPRSLRIADADLAIEAILDRWYQGSTDPAAPIADYFKIRTRDGCERLLKHDRESDGWFLVTEPDEPAL